MRATPARLAACTEESRTGAPSTRIWPSSGRCAPPRILMRVDLPAPFSPVRPSTSPRPRWRETSCSAVTPGKRLVIARISRSGATAAGRLAMPVLREPGLLLPFGEARLEAGHGVLVDDLDARVLDAVRRDLGPRLVEPGG